LTDEPDYQAGGVNLLGLAEQARDVIYRMKLPEGRYEYVNPAVQSLSGYSREEWLAEPLLLRRIIHPDWREYLHQQWRLLLAGQAPEYYEYQIVDRAGRVKWVHQRNRLVTDDRGRPTAIEGTVSDVTELKQAQEELARALGQKEVLLRELQHRVRNNLQGMMSLLALGERASQGPEARGLCRKLSGRLRALSLVHELLMQDEAQAVVAMQDYLERLCAWLVQFYRPGGGVELAVEAGSLVLDLDQASPLGLVVNELVTNSLQHGLAGVPGRLEVRLSARGRQVELSVADDGRGLEPGRAQGLGLEIVRQLVENQLQGRVDRPAAGRGAEVTASFPLAAATASRLAAGAGRAS
jgi:PAS domain S-box-containing protein